MALLVNKTTSQPKKTGLQVLRWIGQLLVYEGADEAELLKSAEEIRKQLLEAHEEDRTVLACMGQWSLHKARAAVTRRRRKDAAAEVRS